MSNELLEANDDEEEYGSDDEPKDEVDKWLSSTKSQKLDPATIDQIFNDAVKNEAERLNENLPELNKKKNVGGCLSLTAKTPE